MKLRDRDCFMDAFAYRPATKTYFQIPYKRYLNVKQRGRVKNRPHTLIQLAHFLRDFYTVEGDQPEIYIWVKLTPAFNYFPHNILIPSFFFLSSATVQSITDP